MNEDQLTVLSAKVCMAAKEFVISYVKEHNCKKTEDIKDPLIEDLVVKI